MLDQSSNNGVPTPPPAEGGGAPHGSSTTSGTTRDGDVADGGVEATKSMSHSQSSSAVNGPRSALQSTASPFVPTAPSSSSAGPAGSYNTAAAPFVPGGASTVAKKVVVGSIAPPTSIGAPNKLQKTASPFVPTFSPANNNNNNNIPAYSSNHNTTTYNALKSTAAPFTPGSGGSAVASPSAAVAGAGGVKRSATNAQHEDDEDLIPDPDKIALTKSNLQSIPFNKIPLHELAAIEALAPPQEAASPPPPTGDDDVNPDAAAPATPKSPRSIDTDDGDDGEDRPAKIPHGAYKEEANRINDIVVNCWERDNNVPLPDSPTFKVGTSQSAHSTPPTSCAVDDWEKHHPPHEPPQYQPPSMFLGGATMQPTTTTVGPQRLNSDDALLKELRELGGYTRGMDAANRPEWMCIETFSQGHVIAFSTDTDGCLALMDVLKETVAPMWDYIISMGPTSGKIDAARHFSSSSKTVSQRDAVLQAELKVMASTTPQIEDEEGRNIVITQLQAVIHQLLPDLFQFSDSAFSSRVVQFFVDTHFAPFLLPIVKGLRGHCLQMAKSGTGSRILRSLLEYCGGKSGDSSVAIVVGHVVSLMTELDANINSRDSIVFHCVHDHYANHVLQCALMNIPGGIGVFMARRIAERFLELSVHPYGARVIQCVFEEVKHPRVSPPTEQAALRLMVQAFRNINTLINNQQGSLVIGHALVNAPRIETPDVPTTPGINSHRVYDYSSIPFSCGSTLGGDSGRLLPIDRTVVTEFGASLVFVDIMKNARSKYGSVVVQRAIESASMETVELLTEKLLQPTPSPLSKVLTQIPHATPDNLRGIPDLAVLVMDGFGNVACQALFGRLSHEYQTLIINGLKPYMPIVLHAKGGKVFIKKVAPELLVLNTQDALVSHMGGVMPTPPQKGPDMTVRVGVAAVSSGRRMPQNLMYDMHGNITNIKKTTPKSVVHDMPPPMYGSRGEDMYHNTNNNNNNYNNHNSHHSHSPATSVGGGGGGYTPHTPHHNNQANITARSNSNSVAHNNNNNAPHHAGGGGDASSGTGDVTATDLQLELLKQEHTNRLLQQQLQFQQMLMQQQTMFMNMQPSSSNASAGGGFGNLQMMMMQNQQMFNGMGGNNNSGNSNTNNMGGNMGMGNNNGMGVMSNNNNTTNSMGLMGGNANSGVGQASVTSGASGSTTTNNNNADINNTNNNGMLGGNNNNSNMFSGAGGLMTGFGGINFNSNNNGMLNLNVGSGGNFSAMDIGPNSNNRNTSTTSSSTGFNGMGDFSAMNFNNMGMTNNNNTNTSNNNGGNNNNNNNSSASQLPNNNMFGFGMMNTLPPFGSNNNTNNWIQTSPLPQNSSSGTPAPASTSPMYNHSNNNSHSN